MKKILVKNDLFNISNRLKSIDKNYFVLFNPLSKKFEIHYKRAKSSLELVLPFSALDSRSVDLVLKTKVEHRKKLLQEMEEHNQKLEREQEQNLIDEASFKTKEMFEFLSQKTFDGDFLKTYQNKWE